MSKPHGTPVDLATAEDVQRYARGPFLYARARLVAPVEPAQLLRWQGELDRAARSCGCTEGAVAFFAIVAAELGLGIASVVPFSSTPGVLIALLGAPVLGAIAGKMAGIWRGRVRVIAVARELANAGDPE